MASTITSTWLDARIESTKTLIVAYEDAMAALAAGQQSYTIDTGQTRQTVTKANLSEMRNALSNLENRLATLDARRSGASTRVLPGF